MALNEKASLYEFTEMAVMITAEKPQSNLQVKKEMYCETCTDRIKEKINEMKKKTA